MKYKVAHFDIIVEHMTEEQTNDVCKLLAEYAESKGLFAFTCQDWLEWGEDDPKVETAKVVKPSVEKDVKNEQEK